MSKAYLRSKGKIYFIGEDRVLCIGYEFMVYKLPPLFRLVMDWDPKVGYRSDQGITDPMWTYSVGSLGSNSTPSFCFDGVDGYLLVAQDWGHVVGIHFPLSADQQPCVRFRIHHSPLPRLGLGLYKGCTGYKGKPICRFRYQWDGDVGDNFLGTQTAEDPHFTGIFFDEETGRCIFRQNTKVIKVVDFV